ncbi:hypothetical protein EAX61_14945 [Dokdonia sinensis]|uniref:Uncharacterized protein n=1 Tax=Dokdonia sinensis TaxID=2479847 RepID=A0A3M0FU90_9FLAO|nr:hypothetical protein EAX61_14945 [Dokdonia sinensis]
MLSKLSGSIEQEDPAQVYSLSEVKERKRYRHHLLVSPLKRLIFRIFTTLKTENKHYEPYT